MKKSLLNLLPVCLVMLFIAACGKKDKTGLLVPKDAAMVVHISASSLSSKISWKELQASNWFQKMYKQTEDSIGRQLMDDPESSGIDSKSDLVYFLTKRNTGGYLVFEGKIKDAAKFETFNKKVSPKVTPVKDGEVSFMNIHNKGIVTWNNKNFVYIYDSPNLNFGNNMSMENSFDDRKKEVNMDSLKIYAKGLMNLSDDNNLGTDDRFASLINETGDVHVWINTSELYSGGLPEGYMSMMNVRSILEDNVHAITLNFDQGKILVNSKQYYSKELTKMIKKFKAVPVEASLINRLPSENIVMAFAVNYPPEGIKEFLRIIGVEGLANGFLSRVDYSIDEFVKGNKGQMLFAITDVQTKNLVDTIGVEKGKPLTVTHEKPDVKFLFANAVNNKAAFDKLINLTLGENEKIQREIPDLTYKVEGDWFVASNSADNVSKFLGGANNNLPFASRISGHPVGGYIDIQKILLSAGGKKSADTSSLLKKSMDMWQDVVITGGDFKNGAFVFNAEINLVNKNENSLRQLNQYFDHLSTMFADRFALDSKSRHKIMLDSVIQPPVIK